MLDIARMKRMNVELCVNEVSFSILFVLLCGFPHSFYTDVIACIFLRPDMLFFFFLHCVYVKLCSSTAASGMYKIVRPAVGESLRFEI